MSIEKLIQKRAEVVNQMHNILDVAEAENRNLSGDEQSQYDRMEKDVESFGERIKRLENQSKLESDMSAVMTRSARPVLGGEKSKSRLGPDYEKAFYAHMRSPGEAMHEADIMNALKVGTQSEGGYIVPEEFETQLLAQLYDINEIRQYCNVIQTASDRHIPVEDTLGTASWLTEEAAYSESDAAFNRVTLGDHKLGTIIKVSEELLRDSFFDMASYLTQNFARRFAIAEEAAFINGDGSNKPAGIVPGSSSAVTAASNNAITTDELFDLQHSLLRPYRANAIWLMNDETVKVIRKLKDGDGQYLWQPGLQSGQPDVLLGKAVITSSAMPTIAADAKSIIFGDMSYYTVADRLGSQVQRLNELYAGNGQVGFRAYKRTDGKVTLSSGIKALVHPS